MPKYVNQMGQEVVEIPLCEWNSNEFTEDQRHRAIALLAKQMGLVVYLTNATSNGRYEVEIKEDV